jgi:predicted phosphoribosyltransferase/dienelactone hydrolase
MAVLLTTTPQFEDRADAGRRLAARLEQFALEDPIVIGLPRGGVPVAYEVARQLEAPLDVVIVRKLGAPIQPELAIGAIGEEGARVVNHDLIHALRIAPRQLDAIVEREQAELGRREQLYRAGTAPLSVSGRTVILVDDGIATGSTATAAARVLRARGAERIVLAVPVGPPGVRARFAEEIDECVCLEQPEGFFSVGAYYEHFGQTSDEEVVELLRRGREQPDDRVPIEAPAGDPPRTAGGIDWSRVRHRTVEIAADAIRLPGDLRLPPDPSGLVIFAHGSGSSRLSPRNVQVAAALNAAGLGTLLFDLLTDAEADDRDKVFDIELLAQRLVAATRWAQRDTELQDLGIGYFGASTGAAAALCAAAEVGAQIRAVVSRGGRPDLAGHRLGEVTAPTLLIVGGADWGVIELNKQALDELRCEKELVLVPLATHLFPEPGALEHVAVLAARWFADHLAPTKRPAAA